MFHGFRFIDYFIVRCVILILVLAVTPGLIGCSKLTAQEIVSNVLSSYEKVDTYSVEGGVKATKEVTGGDRPGTRLTSENGTGTISIKNRQFEMDIMQDGQPIRGMQTSIKQYLVNEWLYIKGDILDYEDKDHEIWVKLDLGDEQLNHNDRLWEDHNPLGQQIELLSTAADVTLAGNENIYGKNSYVLDIKPDWQVLTDWLSLQPPWQGPRFFDLPELASSLSYRMWICKDNYSILKTMIEIECELVSFDSSQSTLELKGEIGFNRYNQPFEVKLPQEAREAVRGPIS
jgi:hypothetical protein